MKVGVLGLSALLVSGCVVPSEKDLLAVAHSNASIESRIEAVETLRKRGVSGFDIASIVKNQALSVEMRARLIELHGKELSVEDLEDLCDIANRYEIRAAAVEQITDVEFLNRIVNNKSFDTLADVAAKRLADLKEDI